MSQKILVVDDELNITDVCKKYLEREGYQVIVASNGEEAIEKWQKEHPDLIVLDLMMPRKNGWEVCQQIRDTDDVPVIMLTARGEEMDRLFGLTIGADDYLTKPFSPRELVLRIKSIFRRVNKGNNSSALPENKLIYNSLAINAETRTATVRGKLIELTVKEFDLLWLLASHPDQVFSRNHLLNQIWGVDYFGDTTTVTVHIRKLREKIEEIPSQPKYIKTVWGIGYKFEGRDN
ncbi:response regulator transcription factor [Candidatus Desulfosporosinus nitrosoreducens]|uniref:response regulator transcription factor n=1 Tax=Candidatus Desulfosporosinus nitrosoreducens TaxID=3401928 RepID=UPI0035ABBD6E